MNEYVCTRHRLVLNWPSNTTAKSCKFICLGENMMFEEKRTTLRVAGKVKEAKHRPFYGLLFWTQEANSKNKLPSGLQVPQYAPQFAEISRKSDDLLKFAIIG